MANSLIHTLEKGRMCTENPHENSKITTPITLKLIRQVTKPTPIVIPILGIGITVDAKYPLHWLKVVTNGYTLTHLTG